MLFLAPYLGDGGINTHMLTLATELKSLGWEVAVCSGKPLDDHDQSDAGTSTERHSGAPVPRDYERAGITHFEVWFPVRVHRLRDLPHLFRLPLAMWQVMRAVRGFRPSLLHSHSRQMGVYGRVVQSLMGLPFVSSAHNPIPTTNRLWALTMGERVFAISNEVEGIVTKDYGVDPERVRIIVTGADAEHFRPPSLEERDLARQHYGLRPGQFVLAFIGSLTANKSPGTIVEAMADLHGSERDVVALLAGQGPEEEKIREQVARLGVAERVRLLDYQDARRLIWAADALVLPSRSEGFGLVVAEAMLCGVVVMRTPAGGADQLIPDVTGVVFGHGDHDELARRIVESIERPDLRETMAVNGLEDARERFSSAGMARAIEENYLEVLDEAR